MAAAASTEALKTLMTRALPVILAVKVTKEADLGAILLSTAPDCLKMQPQIKGNGSDITAGSLAILVDAVYVPTVGPDCSHSLQLPLPAV